MRTVEELWLDFTQTRSPKTKQLLVDHYRYLLKEHAEKLARKLNGKVDKGDLEQDGVFGLMDAIDAFDLTKKVKFKTFSAMRIKGSMLDAIRDWDWTPRLSRDRYKKLRAAVDTLTVELGRKPNYSELADRLKITREILKRWLSDLPKNMKQFSQYTTDKYTEHQDGGQEHLNGAVDLTVNKIKDPADIVAERDYKEYIQKGLDARERLVTSMLMDNMKLIDAAKAIGMSGPAVTSVRNNVYAKLQDRGIGTYLHC
jgi:RNA polymerase sigma factor for flagellar operon FliA